MPGQLMLLDSASLYFRAFHGVPATFRAPDGTPVNAVRGFCDMVATLVARFSPRRLVACWDDDWRPAFRVAALPSYKAHRLRPGSTTVEATPPELDPQVPIIVEVLSALGIARAGAPGYEADDVIGTLAERAASAGTSVDVVTGDRDLFQLVDDDRGVRVLYVGRGVRRLEVIDQGALAERYGVPDGQGYADLAVLRGDPSDGLPGVAGVGEKTAAGLLARLGGLSDLLEAAQHGDDRISPGLRARLVAAAPYLAVAPAVVHVARDAPVATHEDTLPATPAAPDAVLALAERWSLSSPLARLVDALASAAAV